VTETIPSGIVPTIADVKLLTLRRPREEDRNLSRENLPEVMIGAPTISGLPMGERTALRLVDVLACVRALSETASTLPLAAYRSLADEGRQRLTSGRLVDLLERPAPAVTQANLIGAMVAALATSGNVFVGKFRDGEGQVSQIGVLPPGSVTVQIVGGEPIYRYFPAFPMTTGEEQLLGVQDVLHVRLPVTDELGVLGMSPLRQARDALGLARALEVEASAMHANDSTPLGVATVAPGPGADDLLENLKAGLEARHRGSENRGRIAFVTGEVSFSQFSVSPADAQFIEQRNLSTQEIARLFRVPVWLIGGPPAHGSRNTYSNLEQESRSFLTYSLAPYLVAIEQAVTNDPDLCPGGTFVEFIRDAILQADTLTRYQAYQIALGGTQGGVAWMTPEEIRQRENLPPREVVQAQAVAE
jgi:HK97 family phage portal protein